MSTLGSRLTILAYGLVLGATLAALLAPYFWVFELFSHFRVQYVALMLVLLAVFASLGRWLLAASLLPLLVLNILPLLPYLAGEANPPDTTGRLTLASINVYSGNEDAQPLLTLLAAERPDVVVLQEFTPRWAAATATLAERYPYRVLRPRAGNFGLALVSRYPIVREQTISLADTDHPTIAATLQLGTRQLHLLGVHPVPPTNRVRAARRNRQLTAIAELATATPRPLAVLGDFNSTPWSPHLQQLLTRTGLRSAAAGRGLDFTWPTAMPLLGIPIDHCLLSDDLQVIDHYRGPDIGSDHYPLFTEVAL